MADASSTYDLFKAMNFQRNGSALTTKGVHSGPALTGTQRSIIDGWVGAESQCTTP